MLRRLGMLIIAIVVVIASASLAVAAPVPVGPPGDAFYAPPDPLPKGKPGELIQAQPIDGPSGANTWRVLYHSRSLSGDDIAVSGLIVAPVEPATTGDRPILSWGHGGAGIDDRCAPSRQFADPGLLVPFMREYLTQGFVVAASDYEGLGTPGVAPFLVGESEGRSLLDIARAAHNLEEAGAGQQIIVAGHSEGGHAALFAGEIATRYAPELDLLGVMAGAPPANLE
ncbi:MAG: lipase family protein, partial [Thermomicrobiales bacterium]